MTSVLLTAAEVRLSAAVNLSYEEVTGYNLTLSVSDGVNAESTTTLSVNIIDAFDVFPVLTNVETTENPTEVNITLAENGPTPQLIYNVSQVPSRTHQIRVRCPNVALLQVTYENEEGDNVTFAITSVTDNTGATSDVNGNYDTYFSIDPGPLLFAATCILLLKLSTFDPCLVSGELNVTSAVVFDYELVDPPHFYTIIVNVTNDASSNLTASGTVTVYVTDVDENPEFNVSSPQGIYFVLDEFDVTTRSYLILT